jgi:hypothetical protein
MTNIPDHPYTETIAFFLEERLRRVYPGKRVRVFNAAVSGFTLEQGIAKYKALSEKYSFDWVISMDGVNECDTLEAGGQGAEVAYSRAYWASMPFHRFPLNCIVPITQHSAFFNLLKQTFYGVRMRARIQRNEAGGFALRASWAARAALPLKVDPGDERVRRSADAFLREEREFAGALDVGGKHYLLLVQPYLAFRDSVVSGPEETALDHYWREKMNDGYKYAFLKQVYEGIDTGNLHMQTMLGVGKWPGWVFVDYCHFTKAANERIAAELADHIAADGKMRIFK